MQEEYSQQGHVERLDPCCNGIPLNDKIVEANPTAYCVVS